MGTEPSGMYHCFTRYGEGGTTTRCCAASSKTIIAPMSSGVVSCVDTEPSGMYHCFTRYGEGGTTTRCCAASSKTIIAPMSSGVVSVWTQNQVVCITVLHSMGGLQLDVVWHPVRT